SRSDDDRIDSRPFELLDLLTAGHGDIRDGELARGNIGEQLECAVERIAVVIVAGGQQKDLGVEELECEVELDRLRVLAHEPLCVFARVRDSHEPGVSARERGFRRRSHRAPEDGQLGDFAQIADLALDRDGFGALARGRSGGRQVADVGDQGDPVALGDGLAEAAVASHARSIYWPTGCQTVLSSRNEAISQGLCVSGFPWTTRFTLSAAARSRSAEPPSAPVTSMALTSMCEASHGASSSRRPVSRLTAPPGTSEVASASASSIAASGCVSEATATTTFPPVSAGSTRETSPRSGG